MTKAELIERVYGRKEMPRELTKKTVAHIIDSVFVELGDYLIRARASRATPARVSYPGFGTFAKRKRPERSGRNPRTGEPLVIPAQTTVTFSPAQDLKALLNRNGVKNGRH